MRESEFSPWWSLLCEAKGRTPSGPLTRIYATIIASEGISAEQWARACTAAIRHNRFMPTPQELVDLARGGSDFAALAGAAWDDALAASCRGERCETLSAEGRRILNSATIGQPLGLIPLDRLPWVRKEFVERYTQQLTGEATDRTPPLLDTPRKELAHVLD